MRGYKLWAQRGQQARWRARPPGQLKIVDDTSSPNQVVTNYQNADLARQGRPRLRAVLDAAHGSRGPRRVPLPLRVRRARRRRPRRLRRASRQRVLRAAGAGAQRAATPFVKYILSLPKAQRPKTAAYPSLDDPFSSPIADRMRSQFEKAGIKTVFKTIYPPETADLTPIVAKVAAAKPDMVVAGTQSDDAYAQVKAHDPAEVQPEVPVPLERRELARRVPEQGRGGNVNGIFSSGDWFPDSKSAGNPAFVAAYLKKYGGDRLDDRLGLGRGLCGRPADPGRRREDALRRQRDDHQVPAQGRLADDRGQPQLGRQRQPEGRRQPRRMGRRQAPARLPGERRAARADDPEAGLEGLGRRRPPRLVHLFVQACILGLLTGGVYALMASGLTLAFGVMRVVNVAQGALIILGAYLSHSLFTGLGHRPVRLDPDHDAGRVRARRRAPARVPPPAAQRRARAALAARHVGGRARASRACSASSTRRPTARRSRATPNGSWSVGGYVVSQVRVYGFLDVARRS